MVSLRAKLQGVEGLEATSTAVEVMTALLLFAYPPETWYAAPVLRAAAVAALVFRAVRASAWFWFSCFAFWIATVWVTWPWAGNHKYLVAYWLLALTLAHTRREWPERVAVLAGSGRLLLGLAMGTATIAKLLSADYVSENFFVYQLLHFDKFRHFAIVVADCAPASLDANRAAVVAMDRSFLTGAHLNEITLASCPGIGWLARALTYWTIAIEGGVAIAFLWPRRSRRLEWIAHGLFIAFVISTYAIATVVWFGWTMCLLALAHVRQLQARGLSLVYVCLVGLLILYDMPFGAVMEKVGAEMAVSSAEVSRAGR